MQIHVESETLMPCVSLVRDKDSKSHVRALSWGDDTIDKSHLSEERMSGKGLDHKVQLLGAE